MTGEPEIPPADEPPAPAAAATRLRFEAGRTVLSLAGEAAAALLILRECMHHLGFDAIEALATEADTPVP